MSLIDKEISSLLSNDNVGLLADQKKLEEIKSRVVKIIRAPLEVPTPKEKVKKRPDGFDYVESSWMDKVFKEESPLYTTNLLHINESLGWIDIVVSLTDRITGNTELGSGSARIQTRRGVESPGFGDVVDKGNNLTAALSKAIKNAQSRFGHCADIYGKRESEPNEDEKERFKEMLGEIRNISPNKAQVFSEQWKELGTDYSDYLDYWQVFIKRSKQVSPDNTNKNKVL